MSIITTDFTPYPLLLKLAELDIVRNYNLAQSTRVAILILSERAKGEQSKYHLWIESLPKGTSEYPVNYTDEEWEWLKGTNFASMSKEKNDLWTFGDYKVLLAHLPGFKETGWTLDDFKWAVIMT